MSDLIFTRAQDLALRIRRGELSAIEVLEAHLRQIALHNRQLNAIVTLEAADLVRAMIRNPTLACPSFRPRNSQPRHPPRHRPLE
jgi:Asp-tRNA(Asn)/Glu-tRNA(Gln) amidotransferase A subunit family amidase